MQVNARTPEGGKPRGLFDSLLNAGAKASSFDSFTGVAGERAGNLVSSRDVANASLERVGSGEVSDAASRSRVQKVLPRSIAVW